jgi:hypothetical protein
MSKKRKRQKFGDIWVNQTKLGSYFGISAIQIGHQLVAIGLKDPATKHPTPTAINEEYAVSTPLKNGIPFFLWNKKKVKSKIADAGTTILTEQERECWTTAKEICELGREVDATGMDKLWSLYWDDTEIKKEDADLINKYLEQFGSSERV